MARSRYHVLESKPHFVTCTVVNWLPIFSQIEVARIILDSLQFMQEHKRIDLYAYVIMENHLHPIVSSAKLSQEMRNFKAFTARLF